MVVNIPAPPDPVKPPATDKLDKPVAGPTPPAGKPAPVEYTLPPIPGATKEYMEARQKAHDLMGVHLGTPDNLPQADKELLGNSIHVLIDKLMDTSDPQREVHAQDWAIKFQQFRSYSERINMQAEQLPPQMRQAAKGDAFQRFSQVVQNSDPETQKAFNALWSAHNGDNIFLSMVWNQETYKRTGNIFASINYGGIIGALAGFFMLPKAIGGGWLVGGLAALGFGYGGSLIQNWVAGGAKPGDSAELPPESAAVPMQQQQQDKGQDKNIQLKEYDNGDRLHENDHGANITPPTPFPNGTQPPRPQQTTMSQNRDNGVQRHA